MNQILALSAIALAPALTISPAAGHAQPAAAAWESSRGPDARLELCTQAPGASPDTVQEGSKDAEESKGKKRKSGGKKAAVTEKELREELDEAKEAKLEAQRGLRYANAELEIAELDKAVDKLRIKEALRKARLELDEAQEKLDRFESIERPLAETDARMKVEDAMDRVTSSKTDLQGLEEIFEEETEARAKPEILRRARRSLARAEARHEMAKTRAALVIDRELPSKLRSLTSSVRAAEAGLDAEEADAAKKRRQMDLSFEKAVDEADDKKRDAARASVKVEELQKKLNDFRENKAVGSKRESESAKKGAGDQGSDKQDSGSAGGKSPLKQ